MKIRDDSFFLLPQESAKLFDVVQIGLMVVNEKRIIVHANQRLADMLKYDNPETMIGMSARKLHVSDKRYLEFGEQYFDSLRQQKNLNIELPVVRKDGETIWISISGRALDDNYPCDLSKGVLWSIQDITSIKETQEQLRVERDRAQQYLDLTSNIIVALDFNGNISLINRTGCEILEAPESELLGKKWFENYLLVDDIEEVEQIFYKLIQQEIGECKFFENKIRTARGNVRDIIWSNSCILSSSGEVIGVLSSGEDITERKKYEFYLKQQSITDELTGLNNRKEYTNKLKFLMDEYKSHATLFSLLIIDVDNFKLINDTYGHVKGDEILVKISRIFTSLTRTNDYVFRIGGEEFAILVSNTNQEDAVVIAEKIRKKIESDFLKSEEEVTISIGVAEVRSSDTIELIFKRADENLYFAKQHGRNLVIAHT